MSDATSRPEADAAQDHPGPITGSAPQQAEAPGTSALPDAVVSDEDVARPPHGVAAGEPVPGDPDDAER